MQYKLQRQASLSSCVILASVKNLFGLQFLICKIQIMLYLIFKYCKNHNDKMQCLECGKHLQNDHNCHYYYQQESLTKQDKKKRTNFLKIVLIFIDIFYFYFFERERAKVSEWQKERERENPTRGRKKERERGRRREAGLTCRGAQTQEPTVRS